MPHAECRYMGTPSQIMSERQVVQYSVGVRHISNWLQHSAPPSYYRAEGIIKNVNTVEEYANIDKIGMLRQSGKTVS